MTTLKSLLRGLSLIVVVAPLLVMSPSASARDANLSGLNGEQLTADALAQGDTILVFWASWSPRCRDIVPRVNAIAESWSGSARVATVVFLEQRGAVESFLSGKRMSVPVYLDGDGAFSKRNAITDLPGLLILRDGKPLYRGALPADPGALLRRHLG